MAGMKTPTQAKLVLALTPWLAAAALVGCGGGSNGDEGTRAPKGGADGVSARGGQAMIDAQTAMARCMRRQGIDFPDPTPGRGFAFDPGDGRIDERGLRAAERRCARYQRAIAEAAPQLSEADTQRARDMTLRYARCMRRHGADVPDPRAAGEGGGMAVEVPANAKTDPRFQEAARKCEDILRGG
jgi:hypothetical protein